MCVARQVPRHFFLVRAPTEEIRDSSPYSPLHCMHRALEISKCARRVCRSCRKQESRNQAIGSLSLEATSMSSDPSVTSMSLSVHNWREPVHKDLCFPQLAKKIHSNRDHRLLRHHRVALTDGPSVSRVRQRLCFVVVHP